MRTSTTPRSPTRSSSRSSSSPRRASRPRPDRSATMTGNALDFEGKVVLVTGGATGIGRAVARGFARHGAKVVIGDVDPRADETATLIRGDGGEARFVPTDVTDAGAVKRSEEHTSELQSPLNCA